MNLTDSAYEMPKDMEKRLISWLNMDAWGIDEAAPILAGIDPEKIIKPRSVGNGGRLLGAVTLFNGRRIPEPPPENSLQLVYDADGNPGLVEVDNQDDLLDDARYENGEDEGKELEGYFRKCADIARLFNNPSTLPASPKDWIERALSKSIEIPWLKWANERNLLPDGLKETIRALDKDGVFDLVDKSTAEREPKTPGHLNHDPHMQQKANEIAAVLMASKKRKPTKGDVAKHLAPKLGETAPTVERRIRKQW